MVKMVQEGDHDNELTRVSSAPGSLTKLPTQTFMFKMREEAEKMGTLSSASSKESLTTSSASPSTSPRFRSIFSNATEETYRVLLGRHVHKIHGEPMLPPTVEETSNGAEKPTVDNSMLKIKINSDFKKSEIVPNTHEPSVSATQDNVCTSCSQPVVIDNAGTPHHLHQRLWSGLSNLFSHTYPTGAREKTVQSQTLTPQSMPDGDSLQGKQKSRFTNENSMLNVIGPQSF